MFKIENLKGVVDSHFHIGVGNPPFDGFIRRGLNLKSLTSLSLKTGVVFLPKMHFGSLIEPVAKKGKVLIFPSLTLNSKTNGFNPELIKKSAEKVSPVRLAVFFPTIEAETHLLNIDKPWFSLFKPKKNAPQWQKEKFVAYYQIWKRKGGIKVLDKKGNLLPEVKKTIKIIKETGSFLHTGHLGGEEVKKVVEEAIEQKLELVITHANARTSKIKLKTLLDLIKSAKKRGVKIWIELCAAIWICGLKGAYSIKKSFVDWIRALGAENCILSSDANGLEPNRKNKQTNAFDIPKEVSLKTPLDWLEYFVNLLIKEGIKEEEIKEMLIYNPQKLLKIKIDEENKS